DDFCARMLNERVDTSGSVMKRQIPNAFGQRMLRFRMRAGIPTWNTKTGSDEVRARIVECIPRETLAEILQSNSTRCFRDLSDKELLYVEQGNAGKAISRAGGHRLSHAERERRFKKKYAPLNGWEPPNKRPWPENFSTYANGTGKGKRSELGDSRQGRDDSEPSGFQSLSPSDSQSHSQPLPQMTEEKENVPPARRGAPRPYHHAKGMPKDQGRSNDQRTPYSQAQRALNDHLPVPNSDFWKYASIDQSQKRPLHSTTWGYDYARNMSTEPNPETPIIAPTNSSQRLEYAMSPYSQRHGFRIYVPQESRGTYNDIDMPYGQTHVAMPSSEPSRKRKVDQFFSQDEIALPSTKSSRKRKVNAPFSQDETRRSEDLMPPRKRLSSQMQQTPTDSNPPNKGDGRYDDPENYDEVRSIQNALINTLDE
ncbi:MAG: hypothetical protein Q9214_007736, partial [Letrouitia sp. 1 TL-2023]